MAFGTCIKKCFVNLVLIFCAVFFFVFPRVRVVSRDRLGSVQSLIIVPVSIGDGARATFACSEGTINLIPFIILTCLNGMMTSIKKYFKYVSTALTCNRCVHAPKNPLKRKVVFALVPEGFLRRMELYLLVSMSFRIET